MFQLVPSSARLVPWWHLAAGAVLALVPIWLTQRGPQASPAGTVSMLRLAMLPLAVSAAFTLDDPTLNSTAHAPMPVAGRLSVRLALILPVIAASWVGLLGFAASASGLAASTAAGWALLPVGALSLELAALLALTLAAARVAGRWLSMDDGGLAAGPATLAIAFVLYFLVPSRWAFYLPYRASAFTGRAPRGLTDWTAAHQRWAALGLAALFMLAWFSRDPGRYRLRAASGGHLRDRSPAAAGNQIVSSTRQRHESPPQDRP